MTAIAPSAGLSSAWWLPCWLLLVIVGSSVGEEGVDGGNAGADELYHQLGEPSVVTVVTATTGKPELARCIESVRGQSYHGAIQHIVVVDGERFASAVRTVVGALEPAATPSPPYASCPDAPHVKNSPCGASPPPPETGRPGPRWLDVVFLPFNMHGDGGRVYAAGPNMARGEYVSNLDEDNYFASDHIASLVKLLVENDLDWGYSLRTIAMLNQPLAYDRCESLGFLHDVWDWDGQANLGAAHSKKHVDTNCYMARRPVALALANEWNCLPRHNDRCYFQAATAKYPAFGTTRSHTVFYDVDPATEKGLSILGFFSEGLRSMSERYPEAGGTMPWETPAHGGNGAPPPLPLHPACAGFTGDVPFFCQQPQSEDGGLEDGCDEGWTGPDCLECASGYTGDFCTWDSKAFASVAPAPVKGGVEVLAAAGHASASGSASLASETNVRHAKKKRRSKGKEQHRGGINDDVHMQRKVLQEEIDLLQQRVRDSAADKGALLAALHYLAVARATYALSLSDSQQLALGHIDSADRARQFDEAVHAVHRLIDTSPTEAMGLSLLTALLYQHGAGHAGIGGGPRQLQSIREAVRVMRHARRHNPQNRAVAWVYSDVLDELDRNAWGRSHSADTGGSDDPAKAHMCSYSQPWHADTRLPPVVDIDDSGEADEKNWKPLVYVFDGGNMLGTWLELSSDTATAECASSATWVSDLTCLSAADAVVFDCPDGTVEQHATAQLLKETAGGRPRQQLWVLLCGESAARLPLLTDAAFMNRFDIKITHQPDADIKFSYVPRRTQIFIETPPQAKTHFANWIASNCVEHRQRRVQDLMAALCPLTVADSNNDSEGDSCRKVDCLGACLRNTPWPAEGSLEQVHGSTKIALLAQYKFTFAFENSQSEGYVTEKFFQPLIAGSVPVYWGAPDVADFAPDPRSYINVEDFGSAQELADYLSYLDHNDTAYAELLTWKQKPLRREFLERASESDVIGNVYGEGVQHRNPMGGWNPCRLNDLIRQRLEIAAVDQSISTTLSAHGGAAGAPTGSVSKLDGRDARAAWWLPVTAPGEQTHVFRLTESTVAGEVVREYCNRHPCGVANEVALKEAIEASQANIADRVSIEQQLGFDRRGMDGVDWTNEHKYCVLGSRNEGFFSNVLQAIDGLMTCSASGVPATVQWTEEDFPYRGDAATDGSDMKLNAWDEFFLPVGATPGSSYNGKVHVIRDYSRRPRQVPTQFEQFVNSRGDNLHCQGMKDPYDRLRVNHAMRRLGVTPQPWVQTIVGEFVRDNFNDITTGLRAGLVLGVHYRGTDHWDELPGGKLIPFELYLHAVRQVIARWRESLNHTGEGHEQQLPVVFVASDSREAVTKLQVELDASVGGSGEARVVSAADVVRRDHIDDIVAIHRVRGDGRRKGANVLVDSLLLAECDEMVHSQSNVALFAAYTNPKLRLHLIGHERVFGFHEVKAGRPLRFRLNFHAYGGDIEARSQTIWSQARSLDLVGQVTVVDTGATRASNDSVILERGPGEVVGHVIGNRSAVEAFKFRLFTLETLSDSDAADGTTSPVPVWLEADPIVELTQGETAVSIDRDGAMPGMILHGDGADTNHCPISREGTAETDTEDEKLWRRDSKLLPPAQAVGVRVVEVEIDTSAEGTHSTTRVPHIVLLRNMLLPMSCDAVVRLGCDYENGGEVAQVDRSDSSPTESPSSRWTTLQDALHARLTAALALIIDDYDIGQRLVLDGVVQRYSLLQGDQSNLGEGNLGRDGTVFLGRLVLQLSRSHRQGSIIFPYLERSDVERRGAVHADRLVVRLNPNKASCDSTCGESAAAAANVAGVPYCCCGDLLRISMYQGDALWLGQALHDDDALSASFDGHANAAHSPVNPYGYARRCPLVPPVVGLEPDTSAVLPTGGWVYVVTVSLAPT